MSINFNFTQKVLPKIQINVGALLDIPTADLLTGAKGETIYNGGIGQVTAIVGRGNTYKSTIMHYMILSAADKINAVTPTAIATYDTETNIKLNRLQSFANNFEHLPDDMFNGDSTVWSVVDKNNMAGNEWALEIQKYADAKAADKKNLIKLPTFKNPYTNDALEVLVPSFVEIDSLTEFEAASTMEMLSKDLDSSDTNTFAMKQGLFKSKFLAQLPTLSNKANIYIGVTAHVGDKIDMGASPYAPKPAKELQFLKQGDNIKGVGSKFSFLTNHAWITHTPSVLMNQTTKGPEYPLTNDECVKCDLNVVMITMLRSKTGPSGITIPLVVSQIEGVLPSLTEFHFIKENGRYGLEGNNVNYHLALYPDCNLSRTTVRGKLNSDPLLRRAMNITAELLQLEIYHPELKVENLLCTPAELYEDIKKLGYDWNVLLNTRGYWTIDQYTNKVPYLSTVDLLKMRAGKYVPYWLESKKSKETKGEK